MDKLLEVNESICSDIAQAVDILKDIISSTSQVGLDKIAIKLSKVNSILNDIPENLNQAVGSALSERVERAEKSYNNSIRALLYVKDDFPVDSDDD